ncbi:MAG: 1-deoxy-D-xylulose-5-phosphate reductoisomerase [Candidatus Dormibacteraeota bacterium]|nr:1-deoxy-D-xylulose-5-phosphate reductoisomerase [Candidatus Dormibacteraeota bacterium]
MSELLRVAVLGATGSIGTQTLDVLDRFGDRFAVEALVCGRRKPDRQAPLMLRSGDRDFDARLHELVVSPRVDVVVMAIPGAAALRPTLAALGAGKRVALASKEVLVMAGDLVMAAAGPLGDRLRPVDSEHSAIWQCLWGEAPDAVTRITVTASGGPLWAHPEWDPDTLTVEQALAHPRWSMGPKVTIDSATLMNKALEVLEAHHLFRMPMERIQVLVNPQSIVHSIVEYRDGTAKAQIGRPDMRTPIALALSYPERLPGVIAPTDFGTAGPLELYPLDGGRFPAVGLVREAAGRGTPYPAVLNAANEEAVAAFLERRLPFREIVPLGRGTLDAYPGGCATSLDEILAADAWARDHARAQIQRTSVG